MDYSIEYFIEKFSNIPDNKWIRLALHDRERSCALGHCGVTQKGSESSYTYTEEGTALEDIFKTVPNALNSHYAPDGVPQINDCGDLQCTNSDNTTPKERILIHLLKAQEIQNAKNMAHK